MSVIRRANQLLDQFTPRLARPWRVVAAAASGEPAATPASGALSQTEVEELYARYGHLVLRRSRSILRHETLAHDALQTVFLKVLRHGSALRQVESKLGWLYTVTDNCCIDLMKRRRRDFSFETEASTCRAQPPPPVEARSTLSTLLAKLQPRERLVALLLYGDGLTQEEVSQRLGWSRQTVNAKARLIRQLAEEMD
jgi:RNA polymerase sigma-70 factor (ECF subfamily)